MKPSWPQNHEVTTFAEFVLYTLTTVSISMFLTSPANETNNVVAHIIIVLPALSLHGAMCMDVVGTCPGIHLIHAQPFPNCRY